MDPQENWNTSEKAKLLQPVPPPYQDHSTYPPPGSFQSTSGYPAQQFGAPGPYQGPYPGHQAVTVQPAIYLTSTPLAYPLPDYLGYSIFTMLCCCFPLGIAALIYSINVSILKIRDQVLKVYYLCLCGNLYEEPRQALHCNNNKKR